MTNALSELRLVYRGLSAQKRIVSALYMREIIIRWGRRGLGFAWVFAEPLTFALPVLTIWSIVRPSQDRGIPMMAFMFSGYMPLLLFRHISGLAIKMVSGNGALLYHRSVTPMDIFIGRVGLECIGTMGSAALLFTVFYMVGVIDLPYDFSMMLVGFFFTIWWSCAVALIVGPLSERSEYVEHVWAPISYLYIFFSGFFIMADWMSPPIRKLALAIDPPLHCYEIVRQGMFGNIARTYYDIPYLCFMLAVLTVIGLWLMRHVRKHIEFE